jgi:ABC-type Fe3+ transport system permease subunit
MGWDTWRRFAIIYTILLLVLPTYVFMFVFVGTLSFAGWVVVAVRFNRGPEIFGALAGWMAIEALLAFGLAWVANRVSARTRRFALTLGVVCALSAAASPIYCYVEGVQKAVGGCTNALGAFWLGR